MSATTWKRQDPEKITFLRRANTAFEIAVCTSLRTKTMALNFETDLGQFSLIFSFDDMESLANEILHYVEQARQKIMGKEGEEKETPEATPIGQLSSKNKQLYEEIIASHDAWMAAESARHDAEKIPADICPKCGSDNSFVRWFGRNQGPNYSEYYGGKPERLVVKCMNCHYAWEKPTIDGGDAT